MVTVVDGTTREQSLALCERITGLGYGPGGAHKIDMLSVGGGLIAGGGSSGPSGMRQPWLTMMKMPQPIAARSTAKHTPATV
ncbi:hypothetical protein BX265_7255 [Streptomyces sp. TLI_235]|nr:hypothetical protein BX265_7255 [Streptomyces sp. TLI_235]